MNKFKFGRTYNKWILVSFDMVMPPGFDNMMFPIIRRIFARTLAQDIISVQALGNPTGMIFYPDFVVWMKRRFKFGRPYEEI